MNMVAEISMYPLRDDYVGPVDGFLALLNAQEAAEVKTNRTSTLLYGDYDAVLDLLKDAMRASHEQHGGAVFVCKLMPGAPRSINGYE